MAYRCQLAVLRGGMIGEWPAVSADRSRATDRLIAFSDAVVAIAITLLALELPVPTRHTVAELWSSVGQSDGHYAASLISFAVIAATWSHHHDVFRYAERFDARMRSLNMIWLLMIVLIPFAAGC